jgi:hypothetical protein
MDFGIQEGMTMTSQQRATIDKIKRYVLQWDCCSNSPDYEFKAVNMTEAADGSVVVYIVTGKKDEAGTPARACGRRTRRIFVGPRGGVRGWSQQPGVSKRLKGWDAVMTRGYWL